MSTLAVAVLLASLVSKEVLTPLRAAIISAVVFVLFGLLLREHPVPLLLVTPLCFVSHWGAFLVLQRVPVSLLPVWVIAILAATSATSFGHDWLVTKLQMHGKLMQDQIDEFHRLYPDAGVTGGSPGL